MGFGGGPSSMEKKRAKRAEQAAARQEADLIEQERKEKEIEAARVRALRGGDASSTLFGSELGVDSDPLGGAR